MTLPKLTTAQMELALMKEFDIRKNVIVPNVSWGIDGMHECDLLVLYPSGWATEIEIKISRADFKKDKTKGHSHAHRLIQKLYFAVPEWMQEFALANVPDKAGLMIVRKIEVGYSGYTKIEARVSIVKSCKINPTAEKWTDKERLKLSHLGCMRIYSLKSKINKLNKL